MHLYTLSNIKISDTSGSITINLHLNHIWGRRKGALGFGADRLRTLISIANVETVSPLFSVVIHPILFILAGNEDVHELSDEFDIRPNPTTDFGVILNVFIP